MPRLCLGRQRRHVRRPPGREGRLERREAGDLARGPERSTAGPPSRAVCTDFTDKVRQVGQPLTVRGIQSSKATETPATETPAPETADRETASPTDTGGTTEDARPTSTSSAGS